jgi:uncharacterized repeat protein (TIGR03803 family)
MRKIGLGGMLASLVIVFMLFTGTMAASTFKILHEFNGADGNIPQAGLVFDKGGNLYGTTRSGGTVDYGYDGLVFKLAPNADGSWTESVIYSFTRGLDGASPNGGLIFDAAGNLYGTTSFGGVDSGHCGADCGVVFKLEPHSDGSWTESTIYSFTGQPDGANPWAGLAFDHAGNLYGTTLNGGLANAGTVFKLTPDGDGTWTESVLYNFCSLARCADGAGPESSFVFDRAGNIYGTAGGGSPANCPYSTSGCGVVFKLVPNSVGGWIESVLHSFNGGGGAGPAGGVIFDAAGNLHGATRGGALVIPERFSSWHQTQGEAGPRLCSATSIQQPPVPRAASCSTRRAISMVRPWEVVLTVMAGFSN